jgi:predicted RNase H-like HicB family nuclease
VAHVPALKGCWSQGKTREEALQNIREAIDLYLEPEPDEIKDREVVELSV